MRLAAAAAVGGGASGIRSRFALSTREVTAVTGLIVVATGIRLATLGQQSLWEDEAVTRWLVTHDLGHLLSLIPRTESTPPLFYVLTWGTTRVLGHGEIALRLPSAAAGIVTVPLVWAIARRVSVGAGILAAALVALSPDLVFYSQEARAYAIAVALAAASVLALLCARQGSRRALLAWALICAAALATHYFAVFWIVPEAALLLHERRRAALPAIAAVAAVGAALVPLALEQHANGGSAYLGDSPLSERLGQIPTEFLAGPPAPASSAWLVVGAAVLLLFALVRPAPLTRGVLLLVATALTLPLAVDVAGAKILAERNTMAVLPLLFVVAAAGFASRRVGVVAALVLCSLFAVRVALPVLDPAYRREDWRGVARMLGHAGEPRALVIAPVTDNPPPVPRIIGLQSGYLPAVGPLPRHGARVREIDVVDIRGVEYFDTAPAVRAPAGLPDGFELVSIRRASNFSLFRLRSSRPRLVRAGDLVDAGLLPRDVMVGLIGAHA